MADMLYTGGVPGAQDHWAEQFRRPATIGGQPVDYSSGVARMTPTPDEARRAQEAAKRAMLEIHQAQVAAPTSMTEHEEMLRKYSAGLFGAAAMETYMRQHRLRYDVGGRLVQDPLCLDVSTVGSNYDASPHGGALYAAKMPRAPGKMFSRETITSIIRAERTRPQTTDSLETLNRLQSIFENLE